MQNNLPLQKTPPIPKSKDACKIIKDLTGQIIIITGSSTGIGKETARVLAYMNPTIIMACRTEQKTRQTIEEIQKESGNLNIIFMKLDLGDLRSVETFAKEFKSKYNRLDVLINNAGLTSPDRRQTKDGFELVFGTNHLGHFHLTNLLIDTLKASAPSRIINVSSDLSARGEMKWDDIMYEKGYGFLAVYSQSKLANLLFTKELQKRYGGFNVKSVSLHPGVIKTELNREFNSKCFYRAMIKVLGMFQKTPLEGAQTSLFCTLEDHEKLQGGAFYTDSKVHKENKIAMQEENWKRLWDLSEKFIAQAKSYGNFIVE